MNTIKDPGVIGLNYFRNNKSNPQSITDSPKVKAIRSYSSSISGKDEVDLFDYASSGEWGKMSENERSALLAEMKRLRNKTNSYINSAGQGRKRLPIYAALLGLYIVIERKGLLPRMLSFKNVIAFALAYFANFVWSLRYKGFLNQYNPNSPTPKFFFGQTLDLMKSAEVGTAQYFYDLTEKCDFKTYEVAGMMGIRSVLIMDPLDRRYVLKDNWKNYLKNSDGEDPNNTNFVEVFAEVLGRGIFATDRREWQDHRKIAAAMFSVNGLKNQMESVFKSHSEKLVQFLSTIADTPATCDIQNIFQAFTFDTICEIAFGVSPESLDLAFKDEKDEFLVAFDFVQRRGSLRCLEPAVMWRFMKSFGLGDESMMPKYAKFVRDYVVKIIETRKKEGFQTKNDLLSLVLAHSEKSGQIYMQENDYLQDVILNFMLAGRDTTSSTLTHWIMLCGDRANGAEVVKRSLREYDSIDPSNICWKTVGEMIYSDAIFNEVIRMYPPVPGDFRIAQEEDILPSSGFKLQKGTRMVIDNFSIGRDPNLWSDPNSFNPDRWLQKDFDGKLIPVKRPDEYVFPVFWAGSRLCLGKDMARFEAKLVSCSIYKHFSIEVLPHSEKFQNGPVLFHKDPILIKVHSRS